jgi:hypothetical protein
MLDALRPTAQSLPGCREAASTPDGRPRHNPVLMFPSSNAHLLCFVVPTSAILSFPRFLAFDIRLPSTPIHPLFELPCYCATQLSPTMNFVSSAGGREPPETDCLNFMINHVFLPPRLPQEDDATAERQLATVQTLRDSVSDFVSVGCSSVRPALEMLDRFLKTCPGAGPGQADMTTVLRSVIAGLKDGGAYCPLACLSESSLTLIDTRCRPVPSSRPKRRLAAHHPPRPHTL